MISFVIMLHLRNKIVQITNKVVYAVLGVVGVPVHELSHLIVAKLFGRRILDIQLYKPSSDGTLGYVVSSYKPSILSPLVNLLIGLAPIAGGVLSFLVVTQFLRPDVLVFFEDNLSGQNLLSSDLRGFALNLTLLCQFILFSSPSPILTAIWLFLSYSILIHTVPSMQDISNCYVGLIMLLLIIIVVLLISPSFLELTTAFLYFTVHWFALASMMLCTIYISISLIVSIGKVIKCFV
jgi:hypothetical protein